MNLASLLLILACVALGVFGQLALKQGMLALGGQLEPRVGILLQAVTQPFVLLGLGLYAVSMALWLLVLTRAPLSVAYPMLSLGYVVVAVLSRWLFAEPLTGVKMLGILLVCFGVALLAQG